MITVFYDGKCGLCRREIEYYKRIAPPAVFEWVDITVNPKPFNALGFSVAEGLKVLHVKSSDGKIYKGIDAFMAIWQHIPHWRILAKVINFPLIKKIASHLYDRFANWRFKRLGYDACEL